MSASVFRVAKRVLPPAKKALGEESEEYWVGGSRGAVHSLVFAGRELKGNKNGVNFRASRSE